MAINVNFIGRLGADCEVKELSNGRKFISFRIATDEFKKGQNETSWFDVSDFTENALRLAPFLKKGKMLNVHGVETIRLYQTKTGEYAIGRDVTAYRLDFVNIGGGDNTNTQTYESTNTVSQNEVLNQQIQQQPTPVGQVVSFNNTEVNTSYNNDDDLPF